MTSKQFLPHFMILVLVGNGLAFHAAVPSSEKESQFSILKLLENKMSDSKESENEVPDIETSVKRFSSFQELKIPNTDVQPKIKMSGIQLLETKKFDLKGTESKFPSFEISDNTMPGFKEHETPGFEGIGSKLADSAKSDKKDVHETPKLPDVKLSEDKVIVPISEIEKPVSKTSFESSKLSQLNLDEFDLNDTQASKITFKGNKSQCIILCKGETTCTMAVFCPEKLKSSCPTGSQGCPTMTSEIGKCHILNDTTKAKPIPDDVNCQHIHMENGSSSKTKTVTDITPNALNAHNKNGTSTKNENGDMTTTSSPRKESKPTTTTKATTTKAAKPIETTTEEIILIDAFNGGDDIERGIEMSEGSWESGNQHISRSQGHRRDNRYGSASSRSNPHGYGPPGSRGYGPSGSHGYGPSGSHGYGSSGSHGYGSSGSHGYGPSGSQGYGPSGSHGYGSSGRSRHAPSRSHGYGSSGSPRYGPSGSHGYGSSGRPQHAPSGSHGYGSSGSPRYGPSGSHGWGSPGHEPLGGHGPSGSHGSSGSRGYGSSGSREYGSSGSRGYGSSGSRGYGPSGSRGYGSSRDRASGSHGYGSRHGNSGSYESSRPRPQSSHSSRYSPRHTSSNSKGSSSDTTSSMVDMFFGLFGV